MSKAFQPESGFMGGFSKAVDTVILGFLWLLCCIPVFTVGAASSALYYGFHKAIRQDRGYPLKTFFRAFRDNFKQATGIWLMVLVFLSLSGFTCYLLLLMLGRMPMAGFMLSMGVVIMIVTLMWCLYLFPYQSRFQNTWVNVMKNSILLMAANIPRSLLLLILFAAAVALSFYKPAMTVLAVAVYIWLSNRNLERVFRRVMTREALQTEIEADDT